MAAEQTAEEAGGEGAGRDGVGWGPGLPWLWIWPESRTSTTGTCMRIFTLERTAPAARPGFDFTALGWTGGGAPCLRSNSGQLHFLQLAHRHPLHLPLSRPEPVSTFTQQRIAEGLTSGLDLSFTCREFRSLSIPIAAWVP